MEVSTFKPINVFFDNSLILRENYVTDRCRAPPLPDPVHGWMVTWNFTCPALPGARVPVRDQSMVLPETVEVQADMFVGKGVAALPRQADDGLTQQANGETVKPGTLS